MMSGTRKVAFEKWVFRRKINVRRWARKHNINTLSELKSWCEKYGIIAPTAPHILDVFSNKEQVETLPIPVPDPVVPTDLDKPAVNSTTRAKTSSTKKPTKKTAVKKSTKKKTSSKARKQPKKPHGMFQQPSAQSAGLIAVLRL